MRAPAASNALRSGGNRDPRPDHGAPRRHQYSRQQVERLLAPAVTTMSSGRQAPPARMTHGRRSPPQGRLSCGTAMAAGAFDSAAAHGHGAVPDRERQMRLTGTRAEIEVQCHSRRTGTAAGACASRGLGAVPAPHRWRPAVAVCAAGTPARHRRRHQAGQQVAFTQQQS